MLIIILINFEILTPRCYGRVFLFIYINDEKNQQNLEKETFLLTYLYIKNL